MGGPPETGVGSKRPEATGLGGQVKDLKVAFVYLFSVVLGAASWNASKVSGRPLGDVREVFQRPLGVP